MPRPRRRPSASRPRPRRLPNETIRQSLSDAVIEYNKVEKWNGELPQVTGSTGSFINLGAKGAE